MQLFNNEYNWYKGNLHTHTTVSDGALPPEEVLRLYKQNGYDFIALTDHDKLSKPGVAEGMLMLSGIELAYNDMETRVAYHIVGINVDETTQDNIAALKPEWAKKPQIMIDHIKARGGFAVLCHPDWSLMSIHDAMALEGYEAIEIMNSVSDPEARGNSSNFCDSLIARTKKPFLTVASDDAHFYNGDACYSSVYVNAKSLTTEDILEAIRAGRFYSSCGPKFKSINIEKGMITVNASPVKLIRFMSDSFYTPHRRRLCDTCANSGTYPINPNDNFVRIELVDANGRRAWSQYIDVREYK